MQARDVYRFGAFTLDLGERRLSAGSDAIRLSPKAFDVLAALVQHCGRLLTKNELLARVWPESFVDDGILTCDRKRNGCGLFGVLPTSRLWRIAQPPATSATTPKEWRMAEGVA